MWRGTKSNIVFVRRFNLFKQTKTTYLWGKGGVLAHISVSSISYLSTNRNLITLTFHSGLLMLTCILMWMSLLPQ